MTLRRHLSYSAKLTLAILIPLILACGFLALSWSSDKREFLIWVGATSLALSFFLVLLVYWMTRPLKDLSYLSSQIMLGNYTLRICNLPQDELGQIGQSLHKIAGHLQTTVRELTHEQSHLNTILSNMVEAVVAVDNQGRVLIVNPSWARLFGVDLQNATGRPFLEVLRNRKLESLLKQTLEEPKVRFEEIEIFASDEQIFEAQAVPLKEKDNVIGALLVLHDITRIRRLEQIRKDFVANVSHELRTPLASIRGYTETLRTGAIEDNQHRDEFLETIERQTDQMTKLVDDLLALATIESGQKEFKNESVDLLELAKEVAKSLKSLADKKKIKIEVQNEKKFSLVTADRSQLKQVFINLLENAIKFGNEGGRIGVTAQQEKDNVCVSVSDDGLGIPRKDLPRLFERFYRVDKARSRELGGTGLGLAIVKHIVEAHKGSVSVESEEGKGSTFQFRLPLLKQTRHNLHYS